MAGDYSQSEVSSKKVVAGVLAILLGWLGIHKFYLGMTMPGVIMLILSLTCVGYPIMHLIGIIEGIIYLTRSDADFERTYLIDKKGWF
jgi:TM2 domain-containing membrane protein YozV